MILKLNSFKPLLRMLSARKLLLMSTLIFVYFAPAQNFEDYKPLKCEGPVPELFTKYASNRAIESVYASKAQGNNKFERKVLTEYNVSNIFFLDQMLSSGRITYGDEITKYLNKVLDTILKDSQALRKSLSIFTLRSSSTNAFITGYGYIFVTTGLLARLHNEAELAYILCHEISHYTQKHAFDGTVKSEQLISESRNNYRKFEDGLADLYRFSRENELEADRLGLQLFLKTKFSSKAPLAALKLLDSVEAPFLKSFQLVSKLKESSKHSLASFYATNTKINSWRLKKNAEDYLKPGAATSDESKIGKFATHPLTSDRIKEVKQILKTERIQNRTDSLFYINQIEFDKIKKLACYETVYLHSISGELPLAIYLSNAIEETYGKSEFITKIKAFSYYKAALLKFRKAGNARIGLVYQGKEGHWLSYFTMLDDLTDDEFIAEMLNNLNDVQINSNSNFIANLWKLSLNEIAGKHPFTKEIYSTNYYPTLDSLVQDESATFLNFLRIKLKDTSFVNQLFKDQIVSDDVVNLNHSRVSFNSKTKKKKIKRKTVDFDSTILMAPLFYQNFLEKNKSNSSKMINSAEVRNKIVNLMDKYNKSKGWNAVILGTSSNPNISTDEINDYASLVDLMEENIFFVGEIEVDRNLVKISTDYLSPKLVEKKYIALSNVFLHSEVQKFDAHLCAMSLISCFFFPVYLYWQFAPTIIQNYSVAVFNLQTGEFLSYYNKTSHGELTNNALKSNIYNLFYSIKNKQ